MANLIGLFYIGDNADLRYMPDGTPVANLRLAYNYGPKGEDGKRASQWIDAAIIGKRAQSLAPYLTKGTRVFAVTEDPRIETWEKKDGGTGIKLVARIESIEFASNRESSGGNATKPAQGKRQSFDDMGDGEVPF